jgi:hypothetical protein
MCWPKDYLYDLVRNEMIDMPFHFFWPMELAHPTFVQKKVFSVEKTFFWSKVG